MRNHLNFMTFTGRGVKVAVIDSGIDPAHPRIGRITGGVSISVAPDGQAIFGTDFVDRTGHGTACAGIIRRKALEADLFAVRIFDESLSADGRALAAAIRWAVERRVDVVNLSLGTTDTAFRDAIAEACREAVSAGVILVAADHNEGLDSYPATLPEAIGVAGGNVRGRHEYLYRPGEAIECVARGEEQRLCWTGGREIILGGTSFAAPHIAGIVSLIREAYPRASLKEVREALKVHALGGKGTPASRVAPSLHALPLAAARDDGANRGNRSLPEAAETPGYGWIRRAALYPYNKEMHALVRFRDLLPFEIVGVADPPGKRLAGRDAGEAIGIAPVGLRVRPRLQDALPSADTLILGYLDELGRVARRDLLRESIHTALESNLHVFSFLPVPPEAYGDLHETAARRGLKLASPDIPLDGVADVLRRHPADGPVDVPVLGVFGTSAQQGKFTVQLLLRRRLTRMGYRVAQVGTEHHAALFGMDLAFPMGHASPLCLPLQSYAPYLDARMREICRRKRPDLILVGAQSGTIPYDPLEHGPQALPNLAFLLGVRPDACILVVNSIDPEAYIRDTIHAIQALGKAPTILLALGDKEKCVRAAYGRTLISPRQMPQEEIARKLLRLEETFGIPAAEILSEKGQERMIETIVHHFSAGRDREPCQTKRTPCNA